MALPPLEPERKKTVIRPSPGEENKLVGALGGPTGIALTVALAPEPLAFTARSAIG